MPKKRHGEWPNDFLDLVTASKKLNRLPLFKEVTVSQKWVNQTEKNFLAASHHRLRDVFLRLRRWESSTYYLKLLTPEVLVVR